MYEFESIPFLPGMWSLLLVVLVLGEEQAGRSGGCMSGLKHVSLILAMVMVEMRE